MKIRHVAFLISVVTLLIGQLYFIMFLSRFNLPIYSGPLSFNLTAFVLSFFAGIGYFFSNRDQGRRLLWVLIGSILIGACKIGRASCREK